MEHESTPHPKAGDHQVPSATSSQGPSIEARWEKPLVTASGGEVTLLVRVIAAKDERESGRAAPLDVAFVLDHSGSMRGRKLELAKEGVDLAVARLRDVDRAALVAYDDEVDIVQPLEPATPRLKANLRLALHGIDPSGSTFLSGGWVAGCHQIAEALPIAGVVDGAIRIKRVILLTDGLANVGILDPRELARHAGELRRRGIATTTLGVGQDFDEGLLSAMAEAGGGNFQYVADPEGLRAFFTHELQELLSVSATGLVVTLSFPPGLQAELVSVFPVESRASALDVAIGDLPAGDEIDLVFTLRVGEGTTGELVPVDVTARWTDPRADVRREIDVSPVPLRRAEQSEVDAVTPDMLVVEQLARQQAAAERRAGLDLDRAGRYAESRARMFRSRDLLAAAPMTVEVLADIGESLALASEPATAAYESHLRKSAQYRDNLRRRNRQNRDPDISGGNR